MKSNNICSGYLLPHPPIIVPNVGKGKEADASKTITSMKTVAHEISSLKPDTVVLISPHAPMFSDFVFMYDSTILEGDLMQFGSASKVVFEQDSELLTEIERLMKSNNIKGGGLPGSTMRRNKIDSRLDHGSVVPLYYLGSKYKDFKLVVMALSGLDIQRLYKLGQLIALASFNLGRKVAVVASGDMSHRVNKESPYGSCPEGKAFDDMVVDKLTNGNLTDLLLIDHKLREKAGECGYRSLVILCGVFDKQKADVKVLSYEAPFGIGYCVAKFEAVSGVAVPSAIKQISSKKSNENIYIHIARETLEEFVLSGNINLVEKYLNLGHDKNLFVGKAGVFVSIKKFGELRGCIGTTAPTRNSVAEEIIQNAISAGTCDPRFDPVSADELIFLDYSVDVLGEPLAIKSKNELDPKVYGVIVSKGNRRGLLLPDLEGVDTATKQLEIACSKAGIDPNGQYEISKFTVTRYR